jgi:hypothetical protein
MLGADPHTIIREAWEQHGHNILRRMAMVSGGNDSSTLAHWLARHGYIDELLFLDTGIGIEDTRSLRSLLQAKEDQRMSITQPRVQSPRQRYQHE